MAKGDELDFKAMQDKFIEDVETLEAQDGSLKELIAVIDKLPTCYAKGYLMATASKLYGWAEISGEFWGKILDAEAANIWK